MDKDLEKVVRSAFAYLKAHNLPLNPESYFEAFCKEAKKLGVSMDECAWFYDWIGKFDPIIRKELNNYPIKTKSEFIAILANICNHHIKSTNSDIKLVLEKALRILATRGIVEINIEDSLESIDNKLSALLPSVAPQIPRDSAPRRELANLSRILPNDMKSWQAIKPQIAHNSEHFYALVCDICCFDEVEKNFGLDALTKLFRAFLGILRQTFSDKIISVHNNNAIIIATYDLPAAKSALKRLKTTINRNEFVYKNDIIHIDIDIAIRQIRDL